MTASALHLSRARLHPVAWLSLALLGLLGLALVALLWPHWRNHPDLSHGFFMPLVFFVLLRESRAGAARYLPRQRWVTAATALLLALGVLALCAGGLYAASLDWSHTLVAFTLTLAFVFFLLAGLLVFSGDTVRLVPFNWSALVAVGLWLLSAPLPPGSAMRLTLGLQLMVTEAVLHGLHLLGIAATREGNVIDLATTTVGVEEACSGVRSLVSCVFAGFLFSATLVRRPWARALVVALAAPLAVTMNLVRSLALTLLAHAGVDIAGFWHDATGFAVLGVTALLLGGLALLLDRNPQERRPPAAMAPAAPDAAVRPPWLLAGSLALSLALAGFFVANTRPSLRRNLPLPDLASLLPAHVPGWQVRTSDDLYQFSATLRTDHLAQRTYLRTSAGGLEQVTVYLAYWRAGQAPVSLVASHTPDACWPGSGWVAVPSLPAHERLAVGGRSLPEAEARLFMNDRYPQYVWFWHLYDGRPIAYRDPFSPRELLRIAWRYGFRHEGDQLFVRVSSNRPWSVIEHEPFLAKLFTRLQPLGL
jgi:exosortase